MLEAFVWVAAVIVLWIGSGVAALVWMAVWEELKR